MKNLFGMGKAKRGKMESDNIMESTFAKDIVRNDDNNFINELQKILSEKKKQLQGEDDHKEVYDRLVKEALIVIKRDIKTCAEIVKPKKIDDGTVRFESKAFFVTKDLRIYSDNIFFTNNPDTGKECFNTTFEFVNEDELSQFIADVLRELPLEIQMEETKCTRSDSEAVREFTFYINMNI